MNECIYNFYAVSEFENGISGIVYGFDDKNECRRYSDKYRLHCYSRSTMEKLKIDYCNIDNWTDEYFEPVN